MSLSKNGSREHKKRLYELFSQIGSALANPHRLELLDLLVQAPRTVEELANQAQMSVANTSQHLQRLKQARLVVDSEMASLFATAWLIHRLCNCGSHCAVSRNGSWRKWSLP